MADLPCTTIRPITIDGLRYAWIHFTGTPPSRRVKRAQVEWERRAAAKPNRKARRAAR